MYKVFFKDRIIFFESNFSDNFRTKTGLFYRHRSLLQMTALIRAFYDLREIPRLYMFHDDIDFLWSEFKSLFRYIPAAGGLVENDKHQYLVIKRNDIWDLPKGKMEKGENFEQTALREVSEECGLSGLIPGEVLTTTFHTYKIDNQPVLKETRWFNMRVNGKVSAVPQQIEGITDIKWVAPRRFGFLEKNTFPSILDVLKAGDVL